jgi:hypothetical protein
MQALLPQLQLQAEHKICTLSVPPSNNMASDPPSVTEVTHGANAGQHSLWSKIWIRLSSILSKVQFAVLSYLTGFRHHLVLCIFASWVLLCW